MLDAPAPPPTLRGFSTEDWLVLAGYFALLIGTGVFFAFRAKRTTGDYFLGGRSMPVWAVAISILATAQSAATFVGVPDDSYNGDLTYLSTNIGGILAGIVLAWFVIPRYYALGVATPYQLLQSRFGPDAKLAASWAYMIGRVFASGARVYVGAVAVSIPLFGNDNPENLVLAITLFMAFGVVYTLAGGITSVIWTDVFQVCVYLGAAITACVLIYRGINAPASEIMDALSHGMAGGGSKLAVVRTGLDPEQVNLGFSFAAPFTLITAFTGWMLLGLASYGMDQDLVQRMLTCRNAKQSSWSVISGILIGVPAVLVFAILGLLLWVYYTRPELTGVVRAAPMEGEKVFLHYILSADVPKGFAGLAIAGVMAAGPAGINSSLNAMSSTFVSDVYKAWRPGLDERHYVRVGRVATMVWGLVLGLFAVGCIFWKQRSGENILNFVLGVMGFAYAGLLGIFLTALFTRRGNVTSAIIALFAGFVVVLLLQPDVWRWFVHGTGAEEWEIAGPWRLVIGTIAATAICFAGAPDERPKGLPR